MHFKSSLSLMQFFLERNENWSINNINFQWKQAYSFICCRTVSWFCSMRFKDSCSPRRRCSKAWFSWIRCINWVCMKFHQGCSWWPHFPLETIRTAFLFFLLKKHFIKSDIPAKCCLRHSTKTSVDVTSITKWVKNVFFTKKKYKLSNYRHYLQESQC